MTTARMRLAIAEITATLTTDFDLPVLLDTIAADAQHGFDAAAAVVVLLDRRHTADDGDVHIVAQALREPNTLDWSFQRAGPGADSARLGAVTMIEDLAEHGDAVLQGSVLPAAVAWVR